MPDVLVSTAGAASTSGLGAASSGQAQNVVAGVLGRNGSGSGYLVSGAPAWTWWACAQDCTVETTITVLPGAGQEIAVLARAAQTNFYSLSVRAWGDIVLIRADSTKTDVFRWSEGDSFQRQSRGKVVSAGDRLGLRVTGGKIEALVNGAPIELFINQASIGMFATDPTPLTSSGIGIRVSSAGPGRFATLNGKDSSTVPTSRSLTVSDFAGLTDSVSLKRTGVVAPGQRAVVRRDGRWVRVSTRR